MKYSSNFSESSKFSFFAVTFLFCALSYGQSFSLFPDTAYIHTYGGEAMDVGRDIQQTTDRGFIIVGTTSTYGSGNTAIYLIKVDSNCTHQWSRAIGGVGIEWGFSIKQTFDKGYVVAGYTNSMGLGGYDMYLVKTDSTGNILWEKTYGGTDWDFAYCVQQTPDSGFILCGETYSYGMGNNDAFVVRTDKNGNEIWSKTTGSIGKDACYSLIVYNSNRYIFVGESNGFTNGSEDAFYLEMDSSSTILSMKTFGTLSNDKAYWIEKISDGGMAITGESDSVPTPGTIGKNEYIFKLDASGNFQWSHVYGTENSSSDDVINAVKEKQNGWLLTTGNRSIDGSGNPGAHIMMLDMWGWWVSGPDLGGSGIEESYSLAINSKKEVFYIGSTTSFGQGLEDVLLVKLKNDSIVSYNEFVTEFNDTTQSPVGITENETTNSSTIYPNPFSESSVITINNWNELQFKSLELRIFDVFGREIQKIEIRNSKSKILRGSINTGVYFFSISSSTEVISSGKFIIE